MRSSALSIFTARGWSGWNAHTLDLEVWPVIESARYTGSRRVTIDFGTTDTWLESKCPYMTFHRERHGGDQPLDQVVSADGGKLWSEAPQVINVRGA